MRIEQTPGPAPTEGAGAARTAPQPPPQVSRRIELWLLGMGLVLAVIALGGFTMVMNQIDAATFERVVRPALLPGATELSAADAFEAGRTLGAWFGFTLIAVLLLGAAGFFVAIRRPWRKRAGWWVLAAGLACLLGSQLILYPIAFFFFVSAGIFALRRPGSTT